MKTKDKQSFGVLDDPIERFEKFWKDKKKNNNKEKFIQNTSGLAKHNSALREAIQELKQTH